MSIENRQRWRTDRDTLLTPLMLNPAALPKACQKKEATRRRHHHRPCTILLDERTIAGDGTPRCVWLVCGSIAVYGRLGGGTGAASGRDCRRGRLGGLSELPLGLPDMMRRGGVVRLVFLVVNLVVVVVVVMRRFSAVLLTAGVALWCLIYNVLLLEWLQ